MNMQIPGLSDMDAMMREQMRAQMIESYRQTAALHAMTGMMLQAIRDEIPADPLEVAKSAKRCADALVEAVFGG